MEGNETKRIALRDNLTGQGLILTSMALMALGVVTVFSATTSTGGAWYEQTHLRQALFAAVGMLLLCVLWRLDYPRLLRRPWPERRWLRHVPSPVTILMTFAIASAAYTLALGYAVGGYRRWIRFGPVGFQPSEVLKVSLLVALAALLGRSSAQPRSFLRGFVPALVLIGVSAGLIITQDFGTAAIIAIAAVAILLVAGVRWWHVLSLAPICALAFYLLVVCVPHRWARIEAMLHPGDASNPSTYQARQSLIAIGSGVDPAGFGGGVGKYGYVPEIRTDFIFAHIVEELGMGGAMLLIGLFVVWLVLAFRAAARAADRFAALLAGGLGFLMVFQAALHIAVNLALAPPTGVSLPFVSAGGSSLLMMSAATAMIVSVSSRRREVAAPAPEWRAVRSA